MNEPLRAYRCMVPGGPKVTIHAANVYSAALAYAVEYDLLPSDGGTVSVWALDRSWGYPQEFRVTRRVVPTYEVMPRTSTDGLPTLLGMDFADWPMDSSFAGVR